MRIGILTFHYAHNYGAVIQAFAFMNYLKKMNISVDIINYQNSIVSSNYQLKKKCEVNAKRMILHPRSSIKILKKFYYEKKEWETRYLLFNSFIKNYLVNGKRISIDELANFNYDYIIAGSDQIWNTRFTGGMDDAYFLNIPTNSHKIFYAISNGENCIKQNEIPYIKTVLSNFRNISCRESGLAKHLSKILNINVHTVVDPCFLLKKEEYINYLNIKEEKDKKYVFSYFISEDEEMRRIGRIIATALKCDLIESHPFRKKPIKFEKTISCLSPIEFMEKLNNARFIITNSFHGTALSIIFNKQFYSFYKEDCRKDSLLSDLLLSNRHIKNIQDIDLDDIIDYSTINLDEYRKESLFFLSKSLEE